MRVVLLDEARWRFKAKDEWWREHRDAEELFVEEFEYTIEQLDAPLRATAVDRTSTAPSGPPTSSESRCTTARR